VLNRWTNFDELYLKTDINDITVLEGQNPQNRQNRPQYSFSSRNAKLLQSQYLQKISPIKLKFTALPGTWD